MPGQYSNMWNVRANDSCSSTVKFQPFPSTNDEENKISTPIHHGNDNKQSGFLGYCGLMYNEAPKKIAYPSYKDALTSQRHVTDRKPTTLPASSRKDSSRNSTPGRSLRKRPRRKRMKRRTKLNTWENTQNNSWDRSKTQLPEEIKAINRAVIAASRKPASKTDHCSQGSTAEEWNWLRDLRHRANELDDFKTTAGDRLILGYAMEEDIKDIEVNDNQAVIEQFEFVRSISNLIKAAGTQEDQDKDESTDPVPRLASVPDSATAGFRKGWTSRESTYTIGGTKTLVHQEPTARTEDPTTHPEVRPSSASSCNSDRTALYQQPSSSIGKLPTIEEEPSDSLLEPRSTSDSWNYLDQSKSHPLGLFGFSGPVYNEAPDLSVLPTPTKGFFGFRGLVYNEAPKISVLFKPTTDDFRFRRLTYGEIFNARRGSL